MQIFKKLLFAPFFILFFYLSLYFFAPYLNQTDFLFSADMSNLMHTILLGLSLFFGAFFYVIFASLANDWKYVAPAIILAALTSLLFQNNSLYIVAVLAVIVWAGGFLSLNSVLKTYLTFKPYLVLGGTMRTVGKSLIIIMTVAYLLSIKPVIEQKGFHLPDSLINAALKFAPVQQADSTGSVGQTAPALPSISPEQIAMLKQNPALLKQFGISADTLNQISAPSAGANTSATSATQNMTSDLINSQIQTMIAPFLSFIPWVLAALFLVYMYSFLEIFFILLRPLLWLTFETLEATKFIHFETEQREVKKMVV